MKAGRVVKEVYREHGISDATNHNFKFKYCGIEASDIKWLKAIFADLTLEHRILKDILVKSCKASGEA